MWSWKNGIGALTPLLRLYRSRAYARSRAMLRMVGFKGKGKGAVQSSDKKSRRTL